MLDVHLVLVTPCTITSRAGGTSVEGPSEDTAVGVNRAVQGRHRPTIK